MEHHTTTTRAEAERLLGIAEKLLGSKDYAGCKEFAILAQETEPLLDGSEQILAVAQVLLASEKRIGQNHDWYSVLQISQRTEDSDLIKKQYRKFALLLHPDKNKFPFAESAFHLVSDAWNVLSDPNKKSHFDNDFSVFTKIDLAAMKRHKDLQQQQQPRDRNDDSSSSQKLPVRRSTRSTNTNTTTNRNANLNSNAARDSASGSRRRNNFGSSSTGGGNKDRAGSSEMVTFWTVCPYCYNLYEYGRVYLGCCLRCDNCSRAFTGMEISSMPPRVPGKEAYYCCWGFFPMGFVNGDLDGGGRKVFPNWMPPMFSGNEQNNNFGGGMETGMKEKGNVNFAGPQTTEPKKKRGRPRKNV